MKTQIITLLCCCFGILGFGQITHIEYFFNTDQGFELNNVITASGGPSDNLNIDISTEGLPNGFNNLYIRVKDNNNVWSLYEKRVFYITDFVPTVGASNITAAEYFFNIDDGFGNGNPISLGSFPLMFDIDTSSDNLSEGFNNLYIRVKDNLGVWSLYEKRIFYVKDNVIINIPTLVGAEYFYDSDDGFGNNIAAAIVPTGNPDEYTVDIATNSETCDFHDIYLRLQNSEGTWGLYDYKLGFEIFDNAPPTIVVNPNITAELNESGQAQIIIDDVNNGTFDDCELASVVLNQTQFDYTCANLGANSVTITATDAEDKVSNQNVDITVVDLIDPVAVAKNITVQLDSNGEATITGSQIDNGSTDNCSVTNFSLDVSNFDCSDLGANMVTLTAIDQSGNTSTNAPTATVTVEDNVKPTVITQNITVQLNGSGNASITANDIDNGSSDNCTINTRVLDVSAFTCSNLGGNTVTLTVTDQSGNSENNTATVTVEDNVNPTVVTKNITVQLDASGNASIAAAQVDNGSTDNCSISNRSLDVSSFTCANLGTNNVTLTVTDQSGNSENNTATVTVEDNIDPVAIGKNITIDLAGNASVSITTNDVDNGSSDNCGFSLGIDNDTFSSVGMYPVMLTITDSSGNEDSVSVTVTVEDSSLGTEDYKISAKNILLYPNPTDGNLYISTKLVIDNIQILDISGRQIDKLNNPGMQLQIKTLSAGIYFFKFKIENSFITKRIVKE